MQLSSGFQRLAEAMDAWAPRLRGLLEREFDLVIFGATGYVGSLLTASLVGDASKFLSITPGIDGRLR